jgi:hypothetical protein
LTNQKFYDTINLSKEREVFIMTIVQYKVGDDIFASFEKAVSEGKARNIKPVVQYVKGVTTKDITPVEEAFIKNKILELREMFGKDPTNFKAYQY